VTGQGASEDDLLSARRARREGNQILPAELLLVDPAGISVEAIKS